MRLINAMGHIAYNFSPRCQMWYQRVIETDTTQFASRTVQHTQPSTSSSRKRQWVDEGLDDSPAQFRRVRLRHTPTNRISTTEVKRFKNTRTVLDYITDPHHRQSQSALKTRKRTNADEQSQAIENIVVENKRRREREHRGHDIQWARQMRQKQALCRSHPRIMKLVLGSTTFQITREGLSTVLVTKVPTSSTLWTCTR